MVQNGGISLEGETRERSESFTGGTKYPTSRILNRSEYEKEYLKSGSVTKRRPVELTRP